jgi:hypothetical protein
MVIRSLVEEEGFSLAEVDYTLRWITKNLNGRFGGSVKSLGIVPHVIGEALKERDSENKRKEQKIASSQKVKECKQKVEELRAREVSLAELSDEQLELLRQRAIQELQEEGVQQRFMLHGLIKERMLEIFATEL